MESDSSYPFTAAHSLQFAQLLHLHFVEDQNLPNLVESASLFVGPMARPFVVVCVVVVVVTGKVAQNPLCFPGGFLGHFIG